MEVRRIKWIRTLGRRCFASSEFQFFFCLSLCDLLSTGLKGLPVNTDIGTIECWGTFHPQSLFDNKLLNCSLLCRASFVELDLVYIWASFLHEFKLTMTNHLLILQYEPQLWLLWCFYSLVYCSFFSFPQSCLPVRYSFKLVSCGQFMAGYHAINSFCKLCLFKSLFSSCCWISFCI